MIPKDEHGYIEARVNWNKCFESVLIARGTSIFHFFLLNTRGRYCRRNLNKRWRRLSWSLDIPDRNLRTESGSGSSFDFEMRKYWKTSERPLFMLKVSDFQMKSRLMKWRTGGGGPEGLYPWDPDRDGRIIGRSLLLV